MESNWPLLEPLMENHKFFCQALMEERQCNLQNLNTEQAILNGVRMVNA